MPEALTTFFKLIARARRPRLAGRRQVDGLHHPAEILRDQLGVPHIYAQSVPDLVFAQGYAHAQDRLWQMVFNRALIAGRVSELFGEVAIGLDRWMRTLTMRRVAEYEASQLQGEALEVLQAYAAGVNAAMQAGPRPLEMLLTGHHPEPWAPVDSLAWVKMMAWTLSVNWETELLRGRLAQVLGPERAASLEPEWFAEWPTILPPGLQGANLSTDALQRAAAARPFSGPSPYEGLGSNNWVISGARTTTGKPMLANDMHLGMTIPAVWYENHLCGGGLHVSGITFPGIPGIVAGHNEHVAWGFTNGFPDVQDLYMERLRRTSDGRVQAEYNGAWEDCTVLHETIQVRSGQPVQEEVVITRHGPVINRLSPALMPAEQPLALRWTALDPDQMMTAVLGMNRARSAAELHEALRDWATPVQNVVYADVDGNIGYTFPGRVPVRRKGDGSLPVPGWTDEYEWEAYVPYEALPHLVNPPQGYIVTANHRVSEVEYPFPLGRDTIGGDRAQRITELIDAAPAGGIDAAYIRQMQFDVLAAPARRVTARLARLQADPGTPAALALELLRGWDGRMSAESPAAALFQVFMRRLLRLLLGEVLDQAGAPGEQLYARYAGKGPTPVLMEVSLHGFRAMEWAEWMLGQPDSPWWRTSLEGDVRQALADAVAYLQSALGPQPSDWAWGRLHHLYLRHPMGSLNALKELLNRGPYPIGGDYTTVWASGASLGMLEPEMPEQPPVVGPPFRFICDLGDLERTQGLLAPGQSGDPSSPHYDDQIEKFFNQGYHAMPFSRAAVEAGIEKRLELIP